MSTMIDILKKYNFWELAPIPTGFIRESYMERIIPYLNTTLIKVLMGQRRTGKSYLMRQLIDLNIKRGVKRQNILYINKEIPDFDEIKTADDLKKVIELYKKTMKPKGKIYLFLDEVQDIKNWEKIVNGLAQDYVDAYEIFISGSNAFLLSSELATYISGRYVRFEVFSFSFQEYADFHSLKHDKTSFLKYMEEGGLPELYQLTNIDSKRNYVSSLIDTVLLKDVVSRFNIKNASLLNETFSFLVDNIGNLFSYRSIVKFLKQDKVHGSPDTIISYISCLLETYIVHDALRYDIKGKNILSGEKKYYLNDLAFRYYTSSSFDEGLGKILENVVYLHFRRHGYEVYVGTLGNEEIDFIVEKNGEKKYIQVAYLLSDEHVIKREFGNLEKISDNFEKIVVSMDDVSFGNRNGIKHVPVWELGG